MTETRRAAIVGVTGFIGQGLPELLVARGFAVTGVSRSGYSYAPLTNTETSDSITR